MSNTHRYRDRDTEGKLLRKYRRQYDAMSTPRWWRNLFMTRPRRMANKTLCRQLLHGKDYDSMAFPLGNRKPHEYYW